MRLRVRNGWRRVWALHWQWKGLGLVVTSLFAVGIGLSVVLGSNDNAGSGVTTSAPTSTAAATPTSPRLTPSTSPSTSPTSIATSEASQGTPPQQSPSPALAPKPGLTAAEVTECEFGRFDGWDDAFNLKPYGTTLFPASLKVTTDPVACETLWLTSYDGGYSNGTNDRCSTVLEYIDVASPEDLAFCGLEAEPTPTPVRTPDGELLYGQGYLDGYSNGYDDGFVGDTDKTSYYIDPTIGVGSVYYANGYNDGYWDGHSDGWDYFTTIPQGCLPNC